MARIKDLQIITKLTPSKFPLVIGYFSCIHVMHQQLLNKFHNFNVLTFKDFSKKRKNAIYPYSKRIANIEKYKPANIYIYDINSNNLKAEDFIKSVLLKIQPTEIVVGTDFKFGSDHKGIDLLRHYFKVETITYNPAISTTKIVENLKKNNLSHANDFLDEPYYYASKWIGGKKLGRKVGYKTINLEVKNPILLPDGVYITKIKLGTKTYRSVSFIGTSKTMQSTEKTLETYILNKNIRSRFLYPSSVRNEIKLSFIKPIRKNKKFNSIEKLQKQIALDVQVAINYFKENI